MFSVLFFLFYYQRYYIWKKPCIIKKQAEACICFYLIAIKQSSQSSENTAFFSFFGSSEL